MRKGTKRSEASKMKQSETMRARNIRPSPEQMATRDAGFKAAMADPVRHEAFRASHKLRYDKDPSSLRKAIAAANSNQVTKLELRAYWLLTRSLGYSREQVQYQSLIENLFPDFSIESEKVIYESDGSYWHQDPNYDKDRDVRFTNAGWKVVHLTETDLSHIELSEEEYQALHRELAGDARRFTRKGRKMTDTERSRLSEITRQRWASGQLTADKFPRGEDWHKSHPNPTIFTESERERRRQLALKMRADKNNRFGNHGPMSEETKKRMSASQKARRQKI